MKSQLPACLSVLREPLGRIFCLLPHQDRHPHIARTRRPSQTRPARPALHLLHRDSATTSATTTHRTQFTTLETLTSSSPTLCLFPLPSCQMRLHHLFRNAFLSTVLLHLHCTNLQRMKRKDSCTKSNDDGSMKSEPPNLRQVSGPSLRRLSIKA